jgi:RNA recognition motif-containing protein
MERSNGASQRFGFVEMVWQAHAVAAIQGLDGTDLKGRSINVSRAHPRSDGGSRGNPPRGWDVNRGPVAQRKDERRERQADGD